MGRILLLLLTGCCMFCQAQIPAAYHNKLSPALISKLNKEEKKSGNLLVTFSFKDQQAFHAYLSKLAVVHSYAPANLIVCTIKHSELNTILKDSNIVFADLSRRAKEELTTGSLDLSVNKLNLAHHLFPQINGAGINASIKEQKFDTNDVDIVKRFFNSNVADPLQSTHATIMATTLAGAGNSSIYGKGAATGARISSSSFAVLLPDDDHVYTDFNISIQNHSYGTAIENFYGADAAAYDVSVFNNSKLVHVFSSGNSGTETSVDGKYSGINNFANITGSFKMAKNIITVGAVDSFGMVANQSSKGPAYDGRIKPDLVAFGNDGSSGAAALVSGTAALIQQQYFNDKATIPSAALVKAILLNSADDHGLHVNYSNGFGNLDAVSAINTVKQNHYTEGTVLKNQVFVFPVTIPANCSQVKIMLTWTDTPAVANAAKALINDLDARLISASSQVWLPWVLDPSPNLASIQLAPIRKIDTLNNVEQITLSSPAAGNYSFEVNGNKMSSASQNFAIAWSFDTVNIFKWTYPTQEDILQTGHSHLIKWENNISGTGTIEYSIDNHPWQMLQSNVNLSQQWFAWTTPDTACTVKLRMNIPSIPEIIESDPFIISSNTDMSVGFNCADSFLLKWNTNSNKIFHVYSLSDKYIQPLITTTDSFIVLSKQQYPGLHYTVIPEINGKPGMPANLINYSTQGIGCYFESFYASLNETSISLDAAIGTLYNVKEIGFEKNYKGIYTAIYKINSPSSTSFGFSDADLQKGLNTYRSVITLNNGRLIYSSEESVYYFPEQPVIIYPNPAKQNQSFHLIAKEPGIYSFTIHDMNGRYYGSGNLNDIIFNKSAGRLGKGVYLVQVNSKEGKLFTQKLVIY